MSFPIGDITHTMYCACIAKFFQKFTHLFSLSVRKIFFNLKGEKTLNR